MYYILKLCSSCSLVGFVKICSFNATFMWEMLRGKRMMFVGDSLNRGQFVSMVCLLHKVIPENAKSMKSVTFDSLTIFRAEVTRTKIFALNSKIHCEFLLTKSFHWIIVRITTRRLSSIGLHFFFNPTLIMRLYIGSKTELFAQIL